VIKVTWIVSKEYEPPFGYAELLSLRVFCKKTGLALKPAQAELERRGLKGVTPDRTLQQISEANKISPLELYRMIKKFEVQGPGQPRSRQRSGQPPETYTLQRVEETFAGTGLGNRSLSDIGKKVGIDGRQLLKRLAAKGITGSGDESLKTLANRHGLAPLELLKAALVPAYRPAK
jgi:hypothetical protein